MIIEINMTIEITKIQANVIQVALDHLYEMHKDIVVDALKNNDTENVRSSSHVLSNINEIQEEIKYKLTLELDKDGK
jgi:flagellin-specific chaperone FliS